MKTLKWKSRFEGEFEKDFGIHHFLKNFKIK